MTFLLMSNLEMENATALALPTWTFIPCHLAQHLCFLCGAVATVWRLAMSIKLSQQTQTGCMCYMWMENSWLMPMAIMSTCIRLLILNFSACKKHQQDRNAEIDA